MEKASLDRINRLLKIIERERNHELLLSMKNLQELGASPLLYIVSVLPCLLAVELVRGEHFVLADLLKLISGSSFQAESIPKPLVRPKYLPLFAQDPKLAQLSLVERDSQPTPKLQRRRKRRPDKLRLLARDWRGLWTGRIRQLASWIKKGRLRCLASLDLLCGCENELLALRGRLPLALRVQTENALNSLVLLRRFRSDQS